MGIKAQNLGPEMRSNHRSKFPPVPMAQALRLSFLSLLLQLLLLSLARAAGEHESSISVPPLSSSVVASAPLSALAPIGSISGSGSSTGGIPPKRPEPPRPRPRPDGPHPDPLKDTGLHPGSSSSAASSAAPASSPAQAPLASSTILVADAPTPLNFSSTITGPAQNQSNLPAMVAIQGSVYCQKCNLRYRGIEGATVQLSCPHSRLSTVTDHHGKFKMEFRHTAPMSFKQNCTVSLSYPTLPASCNASAADEYGNHPPIFAYFTHQQVHYIVPSFTVKPSTC